jgi:hypothetical protein
MSILRLDTALYDIKINEKNKNFKSLNSKSVTSKGEQNIRKDIELIQNLDQTK